MKILQTLRTHWKKSLLAFGISSIGVRYGYNRYCESLLLRKYCSKLSSHIAKPHKSEQKVKTIIVFLNPSASGGKAEKIFKKFAYPMLHLTGIDFIVVPTAYEGHVSSLLKYLPSETEAIVVAGGDGMLQDVVTTVMRDKTVNLPIGFIPLGKGNTVCRRLLDPNHMNSVVDKICQSVIAIAEGEVSPLPILEIVPDEGKPIYSVSYFTWGSIKEYIDSIPRFWWFGGLREYVAMFRFSLNQTCPSSVKGLLNQNSFNCTNLTLTPQGGGISISTWPLLVDKLHFLRNTLFISSEKDNDLIEKLTMVNDHTKDVSNDLVLEPSNCLSKFCVDGEDVECRRISVRYLPSEVKVFVPQDTEPIGEVEVMPKFIQDKWNILVRLLSSRASEG